MSKKCTECPLGSIVEERLAVGQYFTNVAQELYSNECRDSLSDTVEFSVQEEAAVARHRSRIAIQAAELSIGLCLEELLVAREAITCDGPQEDYRGIWPFRSVVSIMCGSANRRERLGHLVRKEVLGHEVADAI